MRPHPVCAEGEQPDTRGRHHPRRAQTGAYRILRALTTWLLSTAWRKPVRGPGPPATARGPRLRGGQTTGTAVPRRPTSIARISRPTYPSGILSRAFGPELHQLDLSPGPRARSWRCCKPTWRPAYVTRAPLFLNPTPARLVALIVLPHDDAALDRELDRVGARARRQLRHDVAQVRSCQLAS